MTDKSIAEEVDERGEKWALTGQMCQACGQRPAIEFCAACYNLADVMSMDREPRPACAKANRSNGGGSQ